MPKDKDGGDEELPGTLERSPEKAQRTFKKTLESAHESYDSEERAHRTAFAALKHSFEKVGDHWEPKDEKGPSDRRAAGGREGEGDTAGGVDVEGHKREELVERARELGVEDADKMNKHDLGRAIARKQD